jgi:hypothetical protein
MVKARPVTEGEEDAASERPSPGRPTPNGTASATLLVIAVLTVVGFCAAYLAALVVVKIGIGGPRLFVGLPLIAVAGLAMALSSRAGTPGAVMANAITAALAAAIGVTLLVLLDVPAPASLLEHSSNVVDVDVKGDDAYLTLSTTTRLTTMPPVGTIAVLSAILASLCVSAAALIRLGEQLAQRRHSSA